MNLTNLTSPLKEQTGSISKRSNLNGTRIGNSYQTRKEKYLIGGWLSRKSLEGNWNGLECIAPYHVPIRYMERQSGQFKSICYFVSKMP
ncbi:hypothetical protein RhiirB3_409813 [Rhizophagus irregularis]|uniref:Uncharacterized protein n=1 Tax=Rhizophagus irregularis (strain DAOM 181602 / DAOM 197198 / MUCL 43194) TaxID=747089 RepID=U9UQE2_RHIID|nr:hypothetical protein RhiirB3_409813 [Rhizophagus irregularis]